MKILTIHNDYLLYIGKDGKTRSVSFSVLSEERKNDFNAFISYVREEYHVIYAEIAKTMPEKLL